MKKTFVAMMLVMMAVAAMAKAPDLTGTVIDEKGEPMPFVNVVMLSLPDSAFVQGAMTDEMGHFQISTPDSEGLLKVSSVGYETMYLNASTVGGQPIQMKEALLILGEVVVKTPCNLSQPKENSRRV